MPVGRFARLLGSKEGHPACWPVCSWQPLADGPAALQARSTELLFLDAAWSPHHLCVWTTLVVLLFSPLHHLSLPETLCSAPCSLPPVLTISSPPSEPLVTQLL